MADVANSSRVRIVERDIGATVLGKRLKYYILGTPDNIDNLDTGRADGPFWGGIKDGSVSEAAGLAAVGSRPAMGWITATPHGGEAAAAEAISKMLYELTARVDCWNLRRLALMDLFLMPVRNPDGRDAPPGGVRTSAWAFDHNRDFGTQNQVENKTFLPLLKRYPGLFYIDAHQQLGLLLPAERGPGAPRGVGLLARLHPEPDRPRAPAEVQRPEHGVPQLQHYDLFVPEYGDSVPSLLSGAAGMTFEKGTSEVYGKQVYDHYLAIDETVNVTVRDKVSLLASWTEQWQEAVDQGEDCTLQPNKLVSPVSETILREVPTGPQVCGYFYRPDNHAGDTAELLRHMQRQGVHVFRFDQAATIAGRGVWAGRGVADAAPRRDAVHPDGPAAQALDPGRARRGPVPAAQLLLRRRAVVVLAAAGPERQRHPHHAPGRVPMTEIGDPAFGSAPGAGSAVYAFDTDSMQSLAMVTELLDAGVTVSRGAAGSTRRASTSRRARRWWTVVASRSPAPGCAALA